MTQGLSRVEELFEARNPKYSAEIADIDGIVEVMQEDDETIVRVTSDKLTEEEYYYGDDYEVLVKEGEEVKEKQMIARNKKEKQKVLAKFGGKVRKISQ